tara:strand:+ start:471 stop:959 length:489 start_codon:yes stop_codon:yes gene_type:complete
VDRTIAVSGTIAILVVGFLTAASGCEFDDLIAFEPPQGVRNAIAEPETKYTLADADEVWNAWEGFVRFETENLAVVTDKAEERRAVLESVISTSVDFINQNQALFPGGAIVAGIAGMAAGLFVPKPGTKKKLESAKKEALETSSEQLTNVLKVLAEKNKAKK